MRMFSRIVVCIVIFGYTNNVLAKPSYCYSREVNLQIFIAWKCDQQTEKCLRVRTNDGKNDEYCLTSLNVCNLLCNRNASIWPLPTGNISIRKELMPIHFNITTGIFDLPVGKRELQRQFQALETYFTQVLSYTFKKLLQTEPDEGVATIKIAFILKDGQSTSLAYNTPSEKYHLKVQQGKDKLVNVSIEADTYFGARHGIETLLQLIVYDEMTGSCLLPSHVDIEDAPVYKHRGILLDTSRSFYTVEAIKRLLDGMAYNKMNIFHWHMTDSQSFPFLSSHYPEMAAYGAYMPNQVYTGSDIREIVKYAGVRGIKVLPELDTPAHVGEGWQYFEKDVLLCFKEEPWTKFCFEPPCGLLNPVSERVYEILQNLYSEFNELFHLDMFHMGGDEISFNCWNETESVLQWLNARNLSRSYENFLLLWSLFQKKAVDKLDSAVNKDERTKIILWTSALTESRRVKEFLDPNRYIIQVWTGSQDKQVVDLINDGYQIIMSSTDFLYFNYGFDSWIGECEQMCAPYSSWRKIYRYNLTSFANKTDSSHSISRYDYESQILGAEAALWSEQAGPNALDTRLWPRAAALAERLWSNPSTGWQEAENRMLRQRERMAERNIVGDVIQPLWCHQNEGMCHD